MKRKFACLLGAALLAIGGAIHAAEPAKPMTKPMETKPQMAAKSEVKHPAMHPMKHVTIKEVITKVEAAGYKHITEIKLKKDYWKVEALNKEGKKVNVKVNLEGKIVEVKKDFF